MEELRYINKYFKCDDCNSRFKKLVHASEEKTVCINCNRPNANALEENEFNRELADRTYRLAFTEDANLQREHHPTTDVLDRDRNNIFGDPRRQRSPREQTRIPNGGVREPTRSSTSSNGRPNGTAGAGVRFHPYEGPQSRYTQQRAIRPQRFAQSLFMPFTISPFHGSVHTQNIGIPMFDDVFTSFFHVPNTDFFMDNFASNFTSSFDDPLTRIVFMESMQNQPTGTPPASKEAVSKLKKFKMTEEYCKKDPDKQTLEYPACSVCLTDIAKDEDTVLVPCGHMFHDQCIMKWLEMHSSCPVCRFELPTDDPDYERNRQNRPNGSVNNSSNSRNSTTGIYSNGRW
jgi:hypothetical protein